MGRHYEHLGAEERGTIMALRGQGIGVRAIARLLIRAPSTVLRELRRNGDQFGRCTPFNGRPLRVPGYDARRAGERARRLRRRRRIVRKLDRHGPLWSEVHRLFLLKWSPQQIAGRLKSVSHETIYTAIYAMPRGSLRRELTRLLRQGRARRRPRSRGTARRGQMQDLPSIHLRPPAADERLLPGHWEGDLLRGAANRSAVGVRVDRHTLFLMIVRMDGTTAQAALAGFSQAFAPLPPNGARR